MPFLLPPTIALKSTHHNSYLNYSNDPDSEKHGFLKFNGANVFSSLAKFEIVSANTGNGLVHVRCFYNKKFLRTRIEGDVNLSPEADKPDEDPSKWSCTLFEPRAVADSIFPDKVRLFHVYAKQYATVCIVGREKFARHQEEPNDQNIYYIIDLESLVILPRHLAFKGSNDLYLQYAESNQLRFISTDKGIAESWFEVLTDGHGKVKIKVFSLDHHYLRFAGVNFGNFIFADARSDGHSPSEFWPVKIDASTIALKCLDNNKFCRLHTDGIMHDSLNANDTSSSISNSSRLRLEELILSRRIYNTDFDLKNAIIYGETPITMAAANASNNTSVASTVEFKFTYKDSKSSKWTDSRSWMAGLEVTAEFKLPFIGGTQVTAKGEYSGSYEWGEDVTSENTVETTYTVTVPAHATISVSLMATKGKCDVAFTYYQRDVLYNGKTVIYKKEDGLYTGVNSYNFYYEVTTLKDPESVTTLTETESVTRLKKRSAASKPAGSVKILKFSDPHDSNPNVHGSAPNTSIFSAKQQMIPLPMSYGSTGMHAQVTSTTNPKMREP